MIATSPKESFSDSAKQPGDEPLPGYRLLHPLGRGGFGEVWKCEAPGGLHKAIKFVASDELNHSLRQEYEAFQHIKAIRHPFLLQLERVELTELELVMVMELADSQLQERFLECRNAGLPGIPRDELLGYFADAAEALDLLGQKHGLQHLDVKPANLFLISGRVKVGDYGLVRAESVSGPVQHRGFTPRYVAPEVLQGRVDARSDQYSLALVYQELLTGTFAYNGRSPQHMMLLHATGAPDISALPPEDQCAVGVALSKLPQDRFPTCLAFVEALLTGEHYPRHDTIRPNDTATVKTVRMSRVHAASGLLSRQQLQPSDQPISGGSSKVQPPLAAPVPQFGTPGGPPPRLSTVAQRSQIVPRSGPVPPVAEHAAAQGSFIPEEPIDLIAGLPADQLVRINEKQLKSVLPITVLTGEAVVPAAVTGDWFASQLVTAATGVPDSLGRLPDGTWKCRIRCTHPIGAARHKLESLRCDDWFDELTEHNPQTLRLRRFAATGILSRFGGRKTGLELLAAWPGGNGGEIELTAKFFGDPDGKFCRSMAESMPRIFDEFRLILKSGDERRKDARLAAEFGIRVFPMRDNGEILATIEGTCRNVSAGGVAFAARQPIPTRYAYIEFTSIAGLAGLAILTKLIRSQPVPGEQLFAGRFRKDL